MKRVDRSRSIVIRSFARHRTHHTSHAMASTSTSSSSTSSSGSSSSLPITGLLATVFDDLCRYAMPLRQLAGTRGTQAITLSISIPISISLDRWTTVASLSTAPKKSSNRSSVYSSRSSRYTRAHSHVPCILPSYLETSQPLSLARSLA